MIWAVICWYSAGPAITLIGLITARDSMDILDNQVHPVVQMLFPNSDGVFQDDNSPIHPARSVQSWFEEHEDALLYLVCLAQSSKLKIIEPLWSVLESRVRSRFHPPSSVKQLEVVLQE